MFELLSLSSVLLIGLVLLTAVLGFIFGFKTSTKKRRELQRNLSEKSLEALELKSELNKNQKYQAQSVRKDRLVKMALKKASLLEAANKQLNIQLSSQEKQHFIEQSQLRLVSTQASHQAQQAILAANKATAQLHQMEAMVPATQTIQAPPAKSYGQATAVQVKVVDQLPPAAKHDAVSRVSHRDSAFFAQLRSSNEERCFIPDNLQAIAGIDSPTERKLNKAGVFRVEQLANMSDAELNDLANAVGIQHSADFRSKWKGGAQELIRQN